MGSQWPEIYNYLLPLTSYLWLLWFIFSHETSTWNKYNNHMQLYTQSKALVWSELIFTILFYTLKLRCIQFTDIWVSKVFMLFYVLSLKKQGLHANPIPPPKKKNDYLQVTGLLCTSTHEPRLGCLWFAPVKISNNFHVKFCVILFLC